MFACIHALDLAADLSLPEFAYGFSPVVEEAGGRTVVIDVKGILDHKTLPKHIAYWRL